MRLPTEYATVLAYAVRIRAGLRQTTDAGSPSLTIGPKTEPSPTSFQSTRCGTGTHGAWLEVRTISDISGARFGFPYSRRWNCARVYWSGMVPRVNGGPLY